MEDHSEFIIKFDDIPLADANRLARDLEGVLKSMGIPVSRRREDEDSQDFGATLVMVLGTLTRPTFLYQSELEILDFNSPITPIRRGFRALQRLDKEAMGWEGAKTSEMAFGGALQLHHDSFQRLEIVDPLDRGQPVCLENGDKRLRSHFVEGGL